MPALPPPELTPEYFIHQARQFHTRATNLYTDILHNPTDPATNGELISNLVIAVDYLIQLEEARAQHGWIH